MKIARIGVLIDQETAERRYRYGVNIFQKYIGEIFAHVGISFDWLNDAADICRTHYDVVIAALTSNKTEECEQLWSYASNGGTLISYAGLQQFATQLGCIQKPPLAQGYAALDIKWTEQIPLRFFDARPWEPESIGRASEFKHIGQLNNLDPSGTKCGAALQIFPVNKGTIERWAMDLVGTIVRLQQGGQPVTEDGIPAEDGTGAVDEGILKADDQCQMDWNKDRLTTHTGMPYFAHPYADYWREAIIGHLLQALTLKGVTLPFMDYWPEGINQIAMISFDSDLNINEAAELTLDLLNEHQVHSSWCIIEPGFDSGIYERTEREGHELAFHFNALEMEKGIWSDIEFARQFNWLKSAANRNDMVSNKNHYTRFEGWGELFKWCEEQGIQSDQTRGPSKKGNVGFLFGTCQPYFPIAWTDERNRLYDVLEIGFLTQDLNHPSLCDTSIIQPFLEKVRAVRGVAHFLFHQVHLYRIEAVRQAFGSLIEEAKDQGFVFWTGKQINQWQRQRRLLKAEQFDESGMLRVRMADDMEPELLDHTVFWVPLTDDEMTVGTDDIAIRFGRVCQRVQTTQF
jgi:hypothetical protein